MVASISNDQLVWEVWTPAEDTYKDLRVTAAFSPRGARGTPLDTLLRWQPQTDWEPIQRPPAYRLEDVAGPLLDALDDADRWVAAHVALTHVVSRWWKCDAEAHAAAAVRRGPGAPPPPDPRLKELWLRLREMGWGSAPGSGLPATAGGAEPALQPLGDGAYGQLVYGLRADLRPREPAEPFDFGGSYGGKYDVRRATATVDPEQRRRLRDWWRAALGPFLDHQDRPWSAAAPTAIPPHNQPMQRTATARGGAGRTRRRGRRVGR